MYTKVRNYTTDELLDRARQTNGFTHFPKGYWLLGVRSNENSDNIYDDKIYVMKGKVNLDVLTATTNSGSYGFKNWFKWSKKGVGMIKSNEWYYGVWQIGKHRGKMDALKQVGAFKIIRLKSKEDKNTSWTWESWKGFNFHGNTYNTLSKATNWIIGGWSTGCQVVNDRFKYFQKWLPTFKKSGQKKYTYLLIEEF